MKKMKIHRSAAGSLVCLAIALLIPLTASAAGTTSGTTISNQASVVYSVGSVTQTPYSGPTTTFAVDTKVIFNVTKIDGSPVQVAPGDNTSGTTRRLQFQLRNDSNAPIRFHVTAANLASTQTVTFGGVPYTDNLNTFSADPLPACFDTNGDHICQAGEEYLTIAADTTNVQIIVNGDMAANAANGSIIGAILSATAVDAGGGTLVETAAPTINGIDIVLATAAGTDNAARSATVTDRDAWQVSAALLTVAKTAAVYSDPLNGTSAPKAIFGAVVTYTITVTNNAGGATATNVTISDSLAAEMAPPAHVAFAAQFHDASNSCGATEGIVVNGVCSSNSGATTDFNVTAANTVTVSGLTIPSPGSATVKFQVIVQ